MMMLGAEGKESRLQEELQRLRTINLSGASLDFGMIAPRECTTFSQPACLELLPMGPLSQSSNSHSSYMGLTAPTQRAAPFPLSWKRLHPDRSRSNSASGNDEVQASYSSGHGGSPRGIDMNQMPSREDDDVAVSSPTSINLKREREKTHDFDLERDRPCDISCRGSDEEEGGTTRKKLRLSKDQSALLEESFKEHSTLNPKQKNALAKQLNLRPRQVEVWFQNRRARTKLKQTEVDCEFLKRTVDKLTDELQRANKELHELRNFKAAQPCMISPDYYMPVQATTLTMCPQCERLTTMDNKGHAPHAFVKPSYGSSHTTGRPAHAHHFTQSSAAC